MKPRVILVLVASVLVLNLNALDAFFIGDDFDFLRLIGRRDSLLETASLEFWGEWEPLWYVTWYLDLALWGLRPLGFHLTNVAWLALAVVALHGFVRELWPEARLAPWATALLFASHPVHDEAVVYLAARGHVICLAWLSLALWMYARARREPGSWRTSWGWFAGAFAAAFLAALAKESALILPAWIATAETLLLGRGRSAGRAVLAGGLAALVFAVPGACSLLLRSFVVGLDSDKLGGPGADWAELSDDLADDLPAYALLGGLPLPFGWFHEPALLAWRPVGWLLIGGAILGGAALVWVSRRNARARIPLGIWWLGLVIAVTALAPVFWADLPLRRRYLFIPTAGIALVAAVPLEWLRTRLPRATWVLLAALVLGGAAASWHRNELYRDAGRVTRHIIETVRGAALDAPAIHGGPAAFLTLPGRYGGDSVSGVYLVHHTDLASALTLYDAPQPEIVYALRFYHADDHTAEVLDSSPERLRLRFSFRTRRAFEAALRDDPADEGRGGLMLAERVAVDETGRTLDYEVRLSPRLSTDRFMIYLYSDGELRPASSSAF